jgi:dTDP-glucose pyrophosphorylase
MTERNETQNSDELFVRQTDSIRDAMSRIDRNARGIVFVVGEDHRLENTVTDGDIRRAILAGLGLDASIAELLKTGWKATGRLPVTASSESTREEQLAIMARMRVRHLPLIDGHGKVAGVSMFKAEDAADKKTEELPVQAVIMAGGFGTRLRPFTDNMPKPMLPIGGRPLMERTIERLHRSGINRINITTHYLPEKIIQHFGTGKRFGVELNYVSEEEPLGTAGSLGLVGETAEPLLVMNGDILTRVDYKELLDFHRANKAELTVGVRQYEFKVPYGVIEANDGIVRVLKEKPSYNFLVNAGIYLLEPSVRKLIPPDVRFDMTDLIDQLLTNGGVVASFPIVEYWVDIGQHDDLKRAQDDISEMRWAS